MCIAKKIVNNLPHAEEVGQHRVDQRAASLIRNAGGGQLVGVDRIANKYFNSFDTVGVGFRMRDGSVCLQYSDGQWDWVEADGYMYVHGINMITLSSNSDD